MFVDIRQSVKLSLKILGTVAVMFAVFEIETLSPKSKKVSFSDISKNELVVLIVCGWGCDCDDRGDNFNNKELRSFCFVSCITDFGAVTPLQPLLLLPFPPSLKACEVHENVFLDDLDV